MPDPKPGTPVSLGGRLGVVVPTPPRRRKKDPGHVWVQFGGAPIPTRNAAHLLAVESEADK